MQINIAEANDTDNLCQLGIHAHTGEYNELRLHRICAKDNRVQQAEITVPILSKTYQDFQKSLKLIKLERQCNVKITFCDVL